ncbi:hypothetical protein ACWDD9_11740 [Kitasatospora sp. NPDC001119]
MRRSHVARPTENAAVARTCTPQPSAPTVVLAGRLAAAGYTHDRHGHALLTCLIKRCGQ